MLMQRKKLSTYLINTALFLLYNYFVTKNYLIKYQKIVIIVLATIVLGLLIFYYFIWSKSSPPFTDTQRSELLQETLNISPINPGMTDTERLKVLSQSSKTSIIKNK